MGPNAMILVFWMLSFKLAFSLSSFILIKRLFSSSSLSAIRVVSSAYLRLLIFLPEILTPACVSSSLAFHTMYSAYKLNKQVTVHSLDVLLSQFGTSLLFHVGFYLLLLDLPQVLTFLTCVQISQEAGKVVWYSHLFQNFPQFVVIHTVKGFSVNNEPEVGSLLEFPCFFYEPADGGNLISRSCTFSKSSLNIWRFSVPYC